MGETPAAVPPQSELLWQKRNEARTRMHDATLPDRQLFKDILNTADPENALRQIRMLAVSTGSESAGQLRALRRRIPTGTWRTVAKILISDLGEPGDGETGIEGQNSSPKEFVARFGRLAPEQRTMIFAGSGNRELQTSLERLLTVTRTGAPQHGASETAEAADITGILAPFVRGAKPDAASAVMRSPKAVDWMTRRVLMERRGASPNLVQAHDASFWKIVNDDPDLKSAFRLPSARD